MSSITLHHINAPKDAGSITAALHDFAAATQQLISALLAKLGSAHTKTISTVSDEAQDMRDLAYRVSQSDPHFADDLYAAADRHEWGDNAN
ncbi:MAG TPA: hypothetical protein VIM63_11670 [Rhodoferax sp.]